MSQKKKLIFIFGLILVLFNGGSAAVYFLLFADGDDNEKTPPPKAHEKTQEQKMAEETQKVDNYYSIRFSYNDAVDLCAAEAVSRNKNLIQLTVNELSSRYKESIDMYYIQLDSHVGTPVEYDEIEHTCDIDPKTQGVAFYKEITKRRAVRPVK